VEGDVINPLKANVYRNLLLSLLVEVKSRSCWHMFVPASFVASALKIFKYTGAINQFCQDVIPWSVLKDQRGPREGQGTRNMV